ncbi:DUF742 domain-containing protein [Streptomyces sp. NPDC059816]|uniref:DUF742 domain-containing protein n=1 Tax=Streptomyces sp. NPDC059816 TaxID=3346960 RepID=UPI0036531A8E
MASHRRPWVEEDTASLRPYAVTRGRTSAPHHLGRDSIVVTNIQVRPASGLQPEEDAILRLAAEGPVPVAELAGRLRLPVQTVKILVGDLLGFHYLILAVSDLRADTDTGNHATLERVLAGLRRL